jgi:hypothetical protein
MKAINITRYLGTLAAALTISVTSLGAQAFEYEFQGTVSTNNGVGLLPIDIGGSLGAFFLADNGGGTIADGDIDNSLGFGTTSDAALRSGSRFAIFNLDSSPAFPAVRNGVANGSTLTVDGLGNITGGAMTIAAAVPTGTIGNLAVDADAGTWALTISGIDIATGTGSFALLAPPPPVNNFDANKVSTMSVYGLIITALGLLLVARRHLKS